MAVSWSGREPDLPDQPFILIVMAVDPADPSGLVLVYLPAEPARDAIPEGLQE